MKLRSAFILPLAVLVSFPLAEAIATITEAVRSGTSRAWLLAGADVVTAGIVLLIAVLLLRVTDRSQRHPLWLLDWRVLRRRDTAMIEDQPPHSRRA